MTTLEIVLIVILWITTGLMLAMKWIRADAQCIGIGLITFMSIVFTPIVLIVAIVRQAFFEDWR